MNKVTVGGREVTPSKIVCVGRNFVDHIHELGNEISDEMVVFVKPNSSITPILRSFQGEQLHYEGELSFIYENGGFSAVGFGLDLTKRNLQNRLKQKGLPWERAKAFNGAALFSPFVEITGLISDLTFELAINGQTVQMGTVDLMINKPSDILTEVLSFMDLNNGDIVMTGTPKGVGPVKPEDVFSATVKDSTTVIACSRWCAE